MTENCTCVCVYVCVVARQHQGTKVSHWSTRDLRKQSFTECVCECLCVYVRSSVSFCVSQPSCTDCTLCMVISVCFCLYVCVCTWEGVGVCDQLQAKYSFRGAKRCLMTGTLHERPRSLCLARRLMLDTSVQWTGKPNTLKQTTQIITSDFKQKKVCEAKPRNISNHLGS